MKLRNIFMAGALVCALPSFSQAEPQQPAFPGAEGFGRYVTGGRGGKVLHVTNLSDDGKEGSFRWACNQSGTRTIVFDVSGTIMLNSELKIRNGNVTIAGQTAPGDGICIGKYPFVISAPNIIIRFMRFRLGNDALKTNPAAHEGDGLGGMDGKDIMVDHCSVSWSIDECLSVYGSHDITVQWCYVTQSLVNSGHSKGSHGYGGNWGGAGASYHHNLIAHHGSRTPRLGPRQYTQTDERMDMRNNVIYNFGGNGCYGGEAMTVNMVNNYYKPGPATPTNNTGKRIAAPGIRTVSYCLATNAVATAKAKHISITGVTPDSYTIGVNTQGTPVVTVGIKDGRKQVLTSYPIDMTTKSYEVDGQKVSISWNDWVKTLHQWGKYYVEGNVNSLYEDVTADNWTIGLWNQIDKNGSSVDYHIPVESEVRATTPMEFVYTTTHDAETAFDRVVDYAGASLHRDEYDRMMANDTRNGETCCVVTGIGKGFINSQDEIVYADGSTGYPKLESKEAPADTDGDGMPDEWETANGLNPTDGEDGSVVCEDGYTNLEHYLNGLVAHIVEAGNAGGTVLEGTAEYGSAAVETIGAETVRPADDRVFNLMGVEVKGELTPGIYIRNGRKFVVR